MSLHRDCNECQFALKRQTAEIKAKEGTETHNLFCNHPNLKNPHLVEVDVFEWEFMKPPIFCPIANSEDNKNENNCGKIEKPQKRTYCERCDIYREITTGVTWDSIQEDKVYHLPPVYMDDRKDYFVLRKNNIHIFAREIRKDGTLGEVKYFYKTDSKFKFLRENKLHQFNIQKLKNQNIL